MNSSVRAIYLVGLLYRNESNDFGDELVEGGCEIVLPQGANSLRWWRRTYNRPKPPVC